MTISIVIPAYNEEKYIAECIESCLRYNTPSLLEIIVVCNASTDRTAEIAARYPLVRVVHESRKGLGYARQKGLLSMRGDIYASLDADSVIHADWLPMIEREFEANPNLACLTGPYTFYDSSELQNKLANLWWTTISQYNKTMVIGGNFAAKRTALEGMGGFDTSIAFWSEDTYVARRIRETGVGELKFTVDFYNYSSARRLQGQGIVTVGAYYAANYLSQMYRGRPFMTGYGERPWENAEKRTPLLSVRRWPSVARAKKYVQSYVGTAGPSA